MWNICVICIKTRLHLLFLLFMTGILKLAITPWNYRTLYFTLTTTRCSNRWAGNTFSTTVPFFPASHRLSSLQEVSEPNRASIYRSLTINISKEMMCYSDFPIPADYPNYMHHSKILKYFKMYAEHFKLLQHIRFQVSLFWDYSLSLSCEPTATS